MTHAALKDRLALVRDALKPIPWAKGEAGNPSMADTVQEAIAALSAMEGEAVGWLVEREGDLSFPRLMRSEAEADSLIRYCNVAPKITKRPVYTVPPPQQADNRSWLLELVPEAQTFNDGMEDREWCAGFNSCRRLTLGNIERSALATHPTPSPGPQGGGKDWRQVRADEIERDIGMRGMSAQQVFTQMRQLIATPPAHQPGEVDMELVEEGLRYFEMTGDKGDERYTREIRKAFAALAPKEAGHDR